jgi:hypothetical protein
MANVALLVPVGVYVMPDGKSNRVHVTGVDVDTEIASE